MAEGPWFCLDAMLKGRVPLAPLGEFLGGERGQTPSIDWYRPNVFVPTPLWISLNGAPAPQNVSGAAGGSEKSRETYFRVSRKRRFG